MTVTCSVCFSLKRQLWCLLLMEDIQTQWKCYWNMEQILTYRIRCGSHWIRCNQKCTCNWYMFYGYCSFVHYFHRGPITLIRNQQESSRTRRNEIFSQFAPHSGGNLNSIQLFKNTRMRFESAWYWFLHIPGLLALKYSSNVVGTQYEYWERC